MKTTKLEKNTMILMIGSILSQVITILVSLVITRLYSVSAIGSWSVYLSLISVISCLVGLKYENAIVLPEKDEDAVNVLLLSVASVGAFSVLAFFIVRSGNADLYAYFERQGIAQVADLIPISLLGAGLFQVFNYWCVRKQQFASVALRNVINSSASGFAEIILGATMVFGQEGVVIGSVAGTLLAGAFIALMSVCKNWRLIKGSISIRRICHNAKRYKKFPLFSTWSALLNQLSSTMATFILAYVFNKEVVGYFSIAQQVLSIPMTFIGNAVGQAFYSETIHAQRANTLDKLLKRVVSLLVGVGFVPMALITICAPELCEFVYGIGWETAGVYIRILMPWLLLVFIVSPITVMFDALQKQKQFLLFNAIIFAMRCIALLVGGKTGNVTITLALYSAVGFIHFVFVGMYILHISKCSFYAMLKTIGETIINISLKYLIVPLILVVVVPLPIAKVAVCVLYGIVFLILEGKRLKNGMGI